ncbi:hypothetical protein F5Y10DRAFT_259644 [Nemania abortiva]|nr:hypothetical protein F5Y10DRAFT_259644 [Nemania abortiva]
MSLDQLHLLPPAQQEAILNGPALDPPPGVMPNFDNPPNGNALCIAVIAVLLVLATSAFILAAYVKSFYVKKLYLEDYLAFAGLALYVADVYCALGILVHHGLFVHQWDVRVKDLAGILYLVHIGSEFYAVSILLLKTAILLEWVRIFVPRGTRGSFFWTCHALLWTNVVFYTAILISANATCKPYAKLWDKTLPGNCSDNNEFDVATASYNFLSDLLILLLPQRMIWRLHLKAKKKIGIAVIFAIGISACTAAAYRLYASIQYLEKVDATYGVAEIALGTEAELVCGILIYYVPTLPKAFKEAKNPFKRLKSAFSWSKSSASTSEARFHDEWRNQSDKPSYPQHIEQSASYSAGSIPNFGEHIESDLTHPGATYPPQMSILRTTQVRVDEERGYGPVGQSFQGNTYQ